MKEPGFLDSPGWHASLGAAALYGHGERGPKRADWFPGSARSSQLPAPSAAEPGMVSGRSLRLPGLGGDPLHQGAPSSSGAGRLIEMQGTG